MHHNFVDLNRSYFYLHAADICADSQLIKITFHMEFLESDQHRGSGLVTLTLSMLNPFCVWERALNVSLSALRKLISFTVSGHWMLVILIEFHNC